MNAIERIERCLRNPVIPNQYDADAREALAAVDALYQAAKKVAGEGVGYTSVDIHDLRSAVRRVEGDQ